MRLVDSSKNVYSEYGEDGMINLVFGLLTQTFSKRLPKVCVEFGASEDPQGSNVANLWSNGWNAILIEADEERAENLRAKVPPNCEVICRHIKPDGEDSIDSVLAGRYVDFMSIDVDGNDYHIWRLMEAEPRVLCVEFNPTVPPHISLHQEYDEEPMGFGSSLKALVDLSLQKGYTFVGASRINAIFVKSEWAAPFGEFEKDLVTLFPLTEYTYLVSDFLGHALATGVKPPWGIHLPYEGPQVLGHQFSITERPEQTMDAYEAKYDNVIRWPQDGMPNISDPDFTGPIPGDKIEPISARNLLRSYMEADRKIICIAVAHIAIEQVNWIYSTAAEHGYRTRLGGGVLTLVGPQ